MSKVSSKTRTVTVKLQYPVSYKTGEGDKEVTEITLKRPKGKHLKGLGKDVNLFEIMQIAAKIAVEDFITPAFFDELDGADYLKVSEVVGDFLDTGPAIGKTV